MNTIDFQLADTQGQAHEYTLTPHPTSEGSMLALRVLAMAGEPIGRLAGGNLGLIMELLPVAIAAAEKADTDEEVFENLRSEVGDLDDLDLDLACIVRDIQSAIVAAGGDKFIKELLKYTARDGQKLSNMHVYDQAYQANYKELFQVIWKVIQANGFLVFWGIS